jgi:hypothetical protein
MINILQQALTASILFISAVSFFYFSVGFLLFIGTPRQVSAQPQQTITVKALPPAQETSTAITLVEAPKPVQEKKKIKSVTKAKKAPTTSVKANAPNNAELRKLCTTHGIKWRNIQLDRKHLSSAQMLKKLQNKGIL